MDSANTEVVRHAGTSLTIAPVLTYTDFSKSLLVVTDASSAAVEAVLSQLDENGREHSM